MFIGFGDYLDRVMLVVPLQTPVADGVRETRC